MALRAAAWEPCGLLDDLLGGFAGQGKGGESLHPAFAGHRVADSVIGEILGRGVDSRLGRTVTDGDGEFHAAVRWMDLILCKIRANFC